MRARYRDGLDDPSLLEPGQIYEYRIDLYATAYEVRRGNRLRVDVSSSNFDRYDRNPNTGAPFGLSASSRPPSSPSTIPCATPPGSSCP